MNWYKLLGVSTGLVFSIVLLYFAGKLIERRNCGAMSTDFDERQVVSRGKAYKYSYITMILLSALQVLVSTVVENGLFDGATWGTIILSFGVVVFACVSIWNNAYTSYKDSQNGKGIMIFFIIMGLFNVAIGIYEICVGVIEIVDGQIKGIPVTLLAGLSLTVIALVMHLKRNRDKKDIEE